MDQLLHFREDQLAVVESAVNMAEDVTFDAYKISGSEWKWRRYDIKTLSDLEPDEVLFGPFAQIVQYEGRKDGIDLAFLRYDFYKICLQDHSIIKAISENQQLELFPFLLYIMTHELIHIVRFSRFLQSFDASDREKEIEEARVHSETHVVLKNFNVVSLAPVLEFYRACRQPVNSTSGWID